MYSMRFLIIYITLKTIIIPVTNGDEKVKDMTSEEQYKKLFKIVRAEQLHAVRNFQKLNSYEKQYKMLDAISSKLFDVIEQSRVVLESSGYIPGISEFPTDSSTREALSNILENTALFGDVILHLPEITKKILHTQNKWKVLFEWSLGLVIQSSSLLDKSTQTLFNLVIQEMYPDKRNEDYVNPYWKEKPKSDRNREENLTVAKKKYKSKPKRMKEPRLHGEL